MTKNKRKQESKIKKLTSITTTQHLSNYLHVSALSELSFSVVEVNIGHVDRISWQLLAIFVK